MTSVLLIGSGNVASHFFETLKDLPSYEVFVLSRSGGDFPGAKQVFTSSDACSGLSFDLVLVAVADDAIREVLQQDFSTRFIVHTSGTVGLDVFKDTPYKDFGVFYPLQTFTKGRKIDMEEVSFLPEANTKALQSFLENMAGEMGVKYYWKSSEERKKLHLAAVFVSNYANFCWDVGNQLVGEKDFSLLIPLMRETLQKAIDLGPKQAQTGPARRGDQNVIADHEEQLSGDFKELYSLLARMIKKRHE